MIDSQIFNNKSMHELFETLRAMLKTMPDNTDVRRAVVFAAWRRAAGPSVYVHAQAFSLEDKKLTVAVDNMTWHRQLVSLAPQYLMKISSVIGNGVIDFIDFQIMPEMFSATPDDELGINAAENALNELGSPELLNAAGKIGDDELRKNFLLAAAGSLAYKKRNGRT